MRFSSLRFFAPLFLAISPMAVPSPVHAAPVSVSEGERISASGLYRLTMSAKNRKTKTFHMVVRESEIGLSAVLIDNETELALINVRMDGTVFKGSFMTSEGWGELELKLNDGAVTGVLTVADKQLTIDGDRN